LITISGGNSVGVFSMNTGVNFTVQNLTIANGNSAHAGGGIYNLGGRRWLQQSEIEAGRGPAGVLARRLPRGSAKQRG